MPLQEELFLFPLFNSPEVFSHVADEEQLLGNVTGVCVWCSGRCHGDKTLMLLDAAPTSGLPAVRHSHPMSSRSLAVGLQVNISPHVTIYI